MRFLLVLFLFISFNAVGQKRLVDVFNRHKFACDEGGTTPEVNICSGEKVAFADSLLKRLWTRKLKSLDKDIQDHSIDHLKRKGQKIDSSDFDFFNKQRAHYSRLKHKLIRSQQAWVKLRERNYEYARESCSGGTACSAIANDVYINDTLDRIKWLEDMMY
jgi:uncharacterized protein YecT (DUF1311 family)